MDIQIKTSKRPQFAKVNVCGSVLGSSRRYEVQEHLETIWYLGYFRVIVKHDFKFNKFNQ